MVLEGSGPQTFADLTDGAGGPGAVAVGAEREEDQVVLTLDEFCGLRSGSRGDDVDLTGQLVAVVVERQVVDVVTERVLDLAANGLEAQDDVRSSHGTGNGNPLESGPQLEGQHEDVDPGDLRDSDRVGDREGSVENTLRTGKNIIQLEDGLRGLDLVVALELRLVTLGQSVNISAEVVENLEGQISKRLLGALELLARVGLSHRQTEVFTDGLPGRLALREEKVGIFGFLGVGVEMLDQALQVLIVHVGLETQLVLEGVGESDNEVEAGPKRMSIIGRDGVCM